MTFAPGNIVEARDREWVVLPESTEELLMLRPLGGTDAEVTGILTALETVDAAALDAPDPTQLGDHRACRLLRDAIRLGFRSSAGPFRSFGRLAFEPRPYQLVPLMMALRQEPVRLLIADDVGIGKTVESLLIARELLDRGEIQRIAILCPPHLAEQWQQEMEEKFNIHAQLVLSGTARKLESECARNQSIFELHPVVIVSTDFIKSDRRRDDFLRTCPEFVIVDEAHTCASGGQGRGARHQRNHLLKGLSADETRHLVLVTATPHSGNEGAFRSLLGLLKPEFEQLPDDLGGRANEAKRRELAQFFVQRRRADLREYLEQDTSFPDRQESEQTYKLTPEYAKFFKRILSYARETVADESGGKFRQRIRWWSTLALLRAIASSPAAAAATLRSRASTLEASTVEEIDKIGRLSVLDASEDEMNEGSDITPGSLTEGEESSESGSLRRRLNDLAKEADTLYGENDQKLQDIAKILKKLVKDGRNPILFCKFIHTSEYVAEQLRTMMPKVEIASITGLLPPEEREARIEDLGQHDKKILVCTDCLSEGINLQHFFDTVIHYDLAWLPTRHEQREGRVDRFNQRSPEVQVLTYYGADNQIDGIVLDVLINKHKKIRKDLQISVPVPKATDELVEAIFEGLLLREQAGSSTEQLYLAMDEVIKPKRDQLYLEWERSADKEKKSRSIFTQQSIKFDEVAAELDTIRAAIGDNEVVSRFNIDALETLGAAVTKNDIIQVDPSELPVGLKDTLPITGDKPLNISFSLPTPRHATYLHRTHPLVEALATYSMNVALDPLATDELSQSTANFARRAGVTRTSKVSKVTTLLLLRLRYQLERKKDDATQDLLVEDSLMLAFEGLPKNANWLGASEIRPLLDCRPEANVVSEQATAQIQRVLNELPELQANIDAEVIARGEELLAAHSRVRSASNLRGVRYSVSPVLPADLLGIYLFLPT
ncbi:MAG: DEAD/DEAH box helicase [Verrucomicrobia bacterium]|jgi:superfamily II DNA or RNA helicase|nr:DEAD/DEAH box helicase [Verrucomicrobiota bacterium]